MIFPLDFPSDKVEKNQCCLCNIFERPEELDDTKYEVQNVFKQKLCLKKDIFANLFNIRKKLEDKRTIKHFFLDLRSANTEGPFGALTQNCYGLGANEAIIGR